MLLYAKIRVTTSSREDCKLSHPGLVTKPVQIVLDVVVRFHPGEDIVDTRDAEAPLDEAELVVLKRRLVTNEKLEELEGVVMFKNLEDVLTGGEVWEPVFRDVNIGVDVTATELDDLEILITQLEVLIKELEAVAPDVLVRLASEGKLVLGRVTTDPDEDTSTG